jgi:hypothetical protein
MNRPKNIECLFQVSLFSLVYCNTPAFWAHSQVTKKMKHSEYVLRPYLFPLRLMNRPKKIECMYLVKLFQPSVLQYISLFGPFISNEEIKTL